MTEWTPTRTEARTLVIAGLAAIGIYICYLLALPFLPAVTWALVLSVLLLPLQRRLEARLPTNLANALSVSLGAVIVVVPVLFVLQQLVREAANAAVFAEALLRGSGWRETLAEWPRLGSVAAWIEQRLDLAGTVSAVAAWLTAQSTNLVRASATQLVTLVLTFYMLFYFLRDRERLAEAMIELSPLTRDETSLLAQRFVETVRATLFGTLVVAVVQGTLGGLMFWLLGLPLPIVWGLVMGMLALVPVLGAFIVWVPAAIVLAVQGEWMKAIVLAVWGGGVVATIDNLLYPMLVGNRLRLHTVPALIGAIGGLLVFGAAGLVLGPAAIVLTIGLIEILKRRFVPADEAQIPASQREEA